MSAPVALLIIAAFALLLLLCAVILHYSVLRRLSVMLPRITFLRRPQLVLVAVVGATASHLLQVLLFAAGYQLLERAFGGALVGAASGRTFMEFVYFSTETYTSLGLGDVFPTGALRLIVGVESIAGLLMIGWTTSFTYLEMRKYWELDGLDR